MTTPIMTVAVTTTINTPRVNVLILTLSVRLPAAANTNVTATGLSISLTIQIVQRRILPKTAAWTTAEIIILVVLVRHLGQFVTRN